MSAVFAMLADESHVPMAKSLWVNAKRQGQWSEDFAVIGLNLSADSIKWFEDRGISVCTVNRQCENWNEIVQQKIHLFSEFFRRWEHVVYYDLDVMILKPINELTLVQGFGAIGDGVELKHKNYRGNNPPLYAKYLAEFPPTDEMGMNGGMFSFSTKFAADQSAFEKMQYLFGKYGKVMFSEESIIGTVFRGQVQWLSHNWNRPIGGLRWPKKTDAVAIHYVGSGYRPWTEGKYYNDLWKRNLEMCN